MATIYEIAQELHTMSIANDGAGFVNDWAGRFDISLPEAERIAARASNAAEFIAVWENEDWWIDANN